VLVTLCLKSRAPQFYPDPGYPAGESNLASLSRPMCRPSTLAEAPSLLSPLQHPSRAKGRVSAIPPRAHVQQLRPPTNADTWSETGLSDTHASTDGYAV